MKKTSKLRKALALLLCIVLTFTTVSLAVSAAPVKEKVSKIEMYGKDHTHNYGEWEVTTPATCSNAGEMIRRCTVSGCTANYTKTIAVTENAHVYGTWSVTKEASCSATGSKTATCTECGHVETQVIGKLEHTIPDMYLKDGSLNPEWTISKAPIHGEGKITQMGYARTSCKICGLTVTQQYYDANNWHVASGELSVIVDATCTTPGYGMKKCAICGDTMTIEIPVVKDAHVFSGLPSVEKPATCHSKGVGKNQCTECHDIIEVEIDFDPDTHVDSMGNILPWEVTTEPYYHKDGFESVDCFYCGVQSRKIFADHGLKDSDYTIRANPTCVKPGLMVAECKNCRITIEKEIPVNDSHSWDKGEVLSQPTCSQEGITVKHCTRHYGHIDYEVTPKTEHTFVKEWVEVLEADCNTIGKEENVCVECSEVVDREIPINDNAHRFIDNNGNKHEWQIQTEATCYNTGLKTNHCYECGKTITEIIPKHSNTLKVLSKKEATCTNEGEITYQCSECSAKVYESISVDPDAHEYNGDAAVLVAPTCQSNGAGLTVCKHCKKELKTILPKDPDTHVDSKGNIVEWKTVKEVSGCNNGLQKLDCYYCGTKTKTLYSTHGMSMAMYNVYQYPSCENGGQYKSKYPCGDCSKYVYIPIEKGHSGTLMSVVRKATCTETGLALYECARGRHLYYAIIPATGHTASSDYTILTQPTCTTEGEKQLYCKTCGIAIQPPEKIEKSHVFSSWIIEDENKATCSKTGIRYRVCQREDCDYYERSTYRISHTPGEWKFAEGYDCTTGGTLERRCTVCNHLLGTQTVKANTHGSVSQANIPACPEHCISTKNVCNLCGSLVAKKDDAWLTVNSSTCGTCGEVVPDDVKRHNSVIIDGKKGYDATCETDGLTNGTLCLICGYETKQQVISATGHEFQYNENGNKVCIKCGAYKVNNKNDPDIGDSCKCFCHDKGTIAKILFKVCNIFWKFLGVNQKCDCGTVHWEKTL